MRMRKLAWAEDFLKEQSVIVQNPSINQGKWHEFLNTQELHVEIGSGKGDYWVKMSELYPQVGWIGIERNLNVAALALKKVEGQPHEHRSFITEDAEKIHEWFGEHEIDVIHLNFSDPWPKKRTSKKRLSHSNFLAKYQKILKKDGRIIMKTDNSKLFEFSIIEFQDNGWKLEEFYVDFRNSVHDEDAISEYEAKFMSKGQPIYRAIWKL